MNASRLILLLVAIVAGGAMAFLVVRGDQPQTQQAQAPQQIKVLVAKQAIGPGQALNPAIVEWQPWPENGIRPEFVSSRNLPDAPSQLDGVVARFEIFPGEPVTQAKLIRAGSSYLSAVVRKGMRAVAVQVDTKEAAGGLIVPNDHVDVIYVNTGANSGAATTIVSNVRVLAINHRVGEITAAQSGNAEGNQERVFSAKSNATLEVSPGQAEILAFSDEAGDLFLSLRSIVDSGENAAGEARLSNGQVKMIGYGVANAFNTTVETVAPDNGNGAAEAEPIFSATNATSQTAATVETGPVEEPLVPNPAANTPAPPLDSE